MDHAGFVFGREAGAVDYAEDVAGGVDCDQAVIGVCETGYSHVRWGWNCGGGSVY